MCGIVGYIGPKQSTGLLIGGLKRLEYRGYDSAGVAVLEPQPVSGAVPGMNQPGAGAEGAALSRQAERAKRRWWRASPRRVTSASATRAGPHTAGPPTKTPTRTATKGVAVVHNGIIENYLELKQALSARGHEFQSRPTPRSSPT